MNCPHCHYKLPCYSVHICPNCTAKLNFKRQKKIHKIKNSITLFVKSPLKITITIIIITICMFSIFQLSMYNIRRVELQKIESLIENSDYSYAYTQLNSFENYNKYKILDKRAYQKIEELQTLASIQFKTGIEVLNKDTSYNLTDTRSFFIDYKNNHAYAENIGTVTSLLKLIEDYSEVNSKITKINSMKDYLDTNKDTMELLDTYIHESKELYTLSNDIVSNKDNSSLGKLLSLINKDIYYYEDMTLEVASLNASDIKNTLFSTEDYESIIKYIDSGVSPAIELYKSFVLNIEDKNINTCSYESWSDFKKLEPIVLDIIGAKYEYFDVLSSQLDTYTIEANNLYTEIKNFANNTN